MKKRPLYRVVLEIDVEIKRLTDRLKELQSRRDKIMKTPTHRPGYYRRKDKAA